MTKKRIIIALFLSLLVGVLIYAYQWYSENPKFHIVAIRVEAIAMDDKYIDDYSEKKLPNVNKYYLEAYERTYDIQEEIFNEGNVYRVVAVGSENKILEERNIDFIYRGQAISECEKRDGSICYQPVVFVFKINFKYSPRVEKIQLYKEGKLLVETNIKRVDEHGDLH